MMRHSHVVHQFVRNIPEKLEAGTLYVSMEYGTASHLCCCGCGLEVVTPFTPTDWRMTFDGETISLRPSIGNWSYPCRSHYVIDRGCVIEAGPWTDAQVEAERKRDQAAKKRYFKANIQPDESGISHQIAPEHNKSGILALISRWWKGS
jgi:hypothetical protein